ncbi:hypothetical protein B5G20_02175 [Collinsella sp. An7]|uniref:glycosyltransferase family 2 protein n=1 Tax=Collinsella sp. An7 TaxID=1965651 RepID=UPI000B37A717|nr:glycosyltransferase family A protein [Collinsella sp. An7]OUN47550.1 hypothetical protein B5G20_02175 [Collinsella sp. An7]
MKYSVVVPAYNCERFVGQCIESILNQTYGSLELIVVDDGSTDETLKICNSYAEKDARMKVIHQENGGPFSARMAAYPSISGDYVLHVDADDCLRVDALETLKPLAESGGYDIIFFEFSPSLDYSSMDKRFPFSDSRPFGSEEKAQYLNLALDTYCLHSMCSKAVKAELLLSMSYPSDAQHLISGEDHLQSLFLLDRADKAYYLMDALYYYRDTSSGTTSTFRLNDYFDFQAKAKYFAQFLQKWKTLPGFSLTDDDFDAYVLLSTCRYLTSAVRNGSRSEYKQAVGIVISAEIFQRADSNHVAIRKLRIDRRLVSRLLALGCTSLTKGLLSLVCAASRSHSALCSLRSKTTQ